MPFGGTAQAAETRRSEMLERLTDELSLRADQRIAIDSIMQHTDSLLRELRIETQPRVRKVLEESRRQIESRLDSGQRVTFAARQSARNWRLPQ